MEDFRSVFTPAIWDFELSKFRVLPMGMKGAHLPLEGK